MCTCVSLKAPVLSVAFGAGVVVVVVAAAAVALVAAAAAVRLLPSDTRHGNDSNQTGSKRTNNPREDDAGENWRWVIPPAIPVPSTRCVISTGRVKSRAVT